MKTLQIFQTHEQKMRKNKNQGLSKSINQPISGLF